MAQGTVGPTSEEVRDRESGEAAPAPDRALLLVAWWRSPARAWVEPLEAAGFRVVVEDRDGARAYRWARDDRPAAVVIDCATLPSHGHELAKALSSTAWGRRLPVILTNVGEAEREQTARAAPGALTVLAAPTSVEPLISLLRRLA
jgi:DNA-binding response OmpR family regulator